MSDRMTQLIEELNAAKSLLDNFDEVRISEMNKRLDNIYAAVERAEKIANAMLAGVPA